jgi:hypothetical protein
MHRCEQILQLPAEQEQQRGGGAGGGVHKPGGVPDAGGAASEQGRGRLPRQHPVAEELLAARLNPDRSTRIPPHPHPLTQRKSFTYCPG